MSNSLRRLPAGLLAAALLLACGDKSAPDDDDGDAHEDAPDVGADSGPDRDDDDDDAGEDDSGTTDAPDDSGTTDEPDDTGTTEPTDADGDGHAVPEDCDDTDPAVHPGAVDTWYDGVDSDCAGDDDFDADGDGDAASDYGGGDCDDAQSGIHSAATEDCGSGIDEDCDGLLGCEDADCATEAACMEDCSNGVDDDGDGLTDCEQVDCIGTATCPALTVALHGGTLRRAVFYEPGFGSIRKVATGMSGTVWARTSAGGTASCAFSDVEQSWRTSLGTFSPATGTGSLDSGCGVSLQEIFPVYLYGNPTVGFRGRHAWTSPWFLPSATTSDTVSGWFGNRTQVGFVDNRVPRSSTTASGAIYRWSSGTSTTTFDFASETHAVFQSR